MRNVASCMHLKHVNILTKFYVEVNPHPVDKCLASTYILKHMNESQDTGIVNSLQNFLFHISSAFPNTNVFFQSKQSDMYFEKQSSVDKVMCYVMRDWRFESLQVLKSSLQDHIHIRSGVCRVSFTMGSVGSFPGIRS
jgi:hypothetical protein